MGELNLFAFDFSEDQEEMFSEENIKRKFALVQQQAKEDRNGYFLPLKSLPENTIMYVDHFVEKGWIERRKNGINILDEHLKYHTLEELVQMYENDMKKVCSRKDVCWYTDVLTVINHSASPIRIQEEIEEELYYAKKEITKKYALQFGLEHFKNKPSSRGHKIGGFSKWVKKNVLPIITEDVLKLSDYDKIEDYFKKSVFFFGRSDSDKSGYREDYRIPPYPEYYQLWASYLDIASLSQADNEDDIELILEYCGRSSGHFPDICNVIYPTDYTFQTYIDSLTDEDRELLKNDRERLTKLHGRDILEGSVLFDFV